MPSATLLKKLVVHNLEGACFYQEFNADCKNAEFEIIDIDSKEEENMWSAFVGIMLSMAYDDVPVPYLDHNWSILLEFHLFDVSNLGVSLESILELVVKSKGGRLEYTAVEKHGNIFSHYYRHEDTADTDNNNAVADNCIGYCKAIQLVLQDVNLYRWHPHPKALEAISDYEDYFLGLHSRLYNLDKTAYTENMNAVFTLHKPTLFDEFCVIDSYKAEGKGGVSQNSKFVYKTHQDDHFNEIQHTHEPELLNLFYSYAEFMMYRDVTIGVFGLLVTDSHADSIVNIFQRMLESTNETSLSQFFMFKTRNARST